jgi:nicotinate phosphoribosyltransferase
VTSDLNEYTIAALRAAPVDSYGVGTSVVTGSGSPASGMVYKLVAHVDDSGAWIPVAKKSSSKNSVGGRKFPIRSLHRGGAVQETIHIGGQPEFNADGRPLHVPLMVDGEPVAEYLGAAGTALARAHRAEAVAELPVQAFALGEGDPAIPTVYV